VYRNSTVVQGYRGVQGSLMQEYYSVTGVISVYRCSTGV
jgi:hypothetical protein